MSTVKIWDVIDTRPPLLYKSCLYTDVELQSLRTTRRIACLAQGWIDAVPMKVGWTRMRGI